MGLVKGIHHVSLTCTNKDDLEKAIDFYQNVLGLSCEKRIDGIVMLDTGCGIVEIFDNEPEMLKRGSIKHFAFAVDDTDACVKACEEAGYEVFDKARDVDIPFNPVYPARVAFVHGPLGEEIEFFQER